MVGTSSELDCSLLGDVLGVEVDASSGVKALSGEESSDGEGIGKSSGGHFLR